MSIQKNVYGLNLRQLALAQINGISFPCKSKMESEVVGLCLLICVCNSPIKKMYGLNCFPITTTATTLPPLTQPVSHHSLLQSY